MATGPEWVWDGRNAAPETYVPIIGLVVSVTLALLSGPPAGGPSRSFYSIAILALTATAAAWMWLARVPYAEREGRTAHCLVYYAVLIILIGLLIALSPYFGFFGITGYTHAMLLPGRWIAPAIAVTAGLETVAQLGGVQQIHGAKVILYGALVIANFVVVGVLFRAGIRGEQDSEKQAKMVGALAEANRRLETAMEENAGLHAQLVVQARQAGILQERRRMAGEIHDTLAQGLTGIIAQLEAAELSDEDRLRRRRHVGLARDLARESLAEARRSVQALRPGPLDNARLPEALENLAGQWTQTSGIPVRMEIDGTPMLLQPALEVVLFRAAQEALANIAKHSNATLAGMTLTYTHDVVALDVLDDGAGFEACTGPADRAEGEANGIGASYGLSVMRQRLRQVGGTLVIESAPGDGTTLSANVPAWGIDQSILEQSILEQSVPVQPALGCGDVR
jgi:signal transduction histidine kinase